MEENEKKAFDFAADTTKQLITISTAIIALMVTFSKDILGETNVSSKTWLMCTWVVFIISILSGVITLMALTGTLQPLSLPSATPSATPNTTSNVSSAPAVTSPSIPNPTSVNHININNKNIRTFSIVQAVAFCIAIIMTGIFGYKSFSNQPPVKKNSHNYMIIRSSILNNDTSRKFIDTLYLPIK